MKKPHQDDQVFSSGGALTFGPTLGVSPHRDTLMIAF